MIISESHRFIFLHNPKCGGTTVRKSLEEYDTTAGLFWGPIQFSNKSVAKEHMPLYVFRRLFPTYFELLNHYLVFVFVRDPYERAVSAFNQIHTSAPGLLELARSGDPEKVEEYRNKLNNYFANLTPEDISGYEFGKRHLVRQRDLAFIDGKCRADLVLHQDNWDLSLSKLALFLPHVASSIAQQRPMNRRSLPGSKAEYFDARGIARVNELYRDDFLLFDYPMKNA